jgi:hypothetical protein
MMNRFLVVARDSTCPRHKSGGECSFEERRRANYERDDRERENWGRHGIRAGRPVATFDRTRYVEPAE